MSRKRYTPEQIISMLREAEVALAQGQSVGQACRTLGVSEQTVALFGYRHNRGVTIAGARNMAAFVLFQAKRLKDLEKRVNRGRDVKPWDAIVMFKTIILCALYNLSDDR